MMKHTPEVVKLPRHMRTKTAEIDAKIAPLIRALWRCGFVTCYTCQGEAEPDTTKIIHLAYITFRTHMEAYLFAAMAGPLAWDQKVHRKREKEWPDGTKRWSWDWHIQSCTVRFPGRDIPRALNAIETKGSSIRSLVQQISDAPVPVLPALPMCSRCGSERISTPILTDDAHRSAPQCRTCGIPILGRRKDAQFCSRRCQLRGRDRRRKK